MAAMGVYSVQSQSRWRSKSGRTHRGVTLLELLTVVALIALLVAILLPSFSAARAQARRLACAANLRAAGNALNVVKTERGRYPLRDPPPQPAAAIRLENITGPIAAKLVFSYLGRPEALYCPSSLKNDPYALGAGVLCSSANQLEERWKRGWISYMYLPGVEATFDDDQGRATFNPTLETPDNGRNPRVVLIGDRVVELPQPAHLAGSNHGREGGWFCLTTGDVQWWSWKRLAAHPEPYESPIPRRYIWYWPRVGRSPEGIDTGGS